MSYIGKVFNKATSEYIDVLISEGGDSYRRLTNLISQDINDIALAKIKERSESGSLFNDHDMGQMIHLVMTNMPRQGPGNSNPHYYVHGETAAGDKLKGGHPAEGSSQQTVDFLFLPHIY